MVEFSWDHRGSECHVNDGESQMLHISNLSLRSDWKNIDILKYNGVNMQMMIVNASTEYL